MFSDAFRDQITALNTGGGKRLLRYIEKQSFKVVIVDTFSRSIQGDQLDPAEMTEAVGPLQQYALSKGIALVIVDHMPKNAGEISDPISHIYGSVRPGLDTAWALYENKENDRNWRSMGVTSKSLSAYFDVRGFYWSCEACYRRGDHGAQGSPCRA
jgi:hypothetical protein